MADHSMYKPSQDSIKEFDENTIKGGPMYVNKLEKKLISKLLNMAADEFSNHGCNDFDLVSDGGLAKEEAYEIQESLFTDNYIEEKSTKTYTMDWMLMRWLAAKIYNDAVDL